MEGAAENEKLRVAHWFEQEKATQQQLQSMSRERYPARLKWNKDRKGKYEAEGPIEISPLNLDISWASDETQWKIEHPGEGKNCCAYAQRVLWFEVKATHSGAKAGKKYKIGFEVSLDDVAFGWEQIPVFLMAKVGESGSYNWKRLNLDELKKNGEKNGEKKGHFPCDYEIQIPASAEDTTLQFGLYEIWSGRWKGGLRIHHAFVNPA